MRGWQIVRLKQIRSWIFSSVFSLLLIPSPAASQDFSKAFQNLRDLGLPDVSSAEYGKISPSNAGMGYGGWDPFASFPNLQEIEVKGNGWRLSSDGSVESFLEDEFQIVTQQTSTSVFTTVEPEEGSKAQRIKWADVDLQKDVETILKALDDDSLTGSLSSNYESSGKLLLFAAHLDAKGLENEASEMVSRLFSLSDDSEKVIASALGLVAGGEYGIAMEKAFSNGNWKEFSTTCENLATRFGAGWSLSAPVSMIAGIAAKQASGPITLPPPESPEHEKITSSLETPLHSLGKNPELDAALFSTIEYAGPWLIPGNENLAQLLQSQENVDSSLLGVITKNSGATIPILIAMLGNDSFLPIPRPGSNSVESEIDRFAKEEGGDPFRSSGFPRPATCADIASAFLIPIIPGFNPHDSTISEVRGRANDWWAEASQSDDLALARSYFYGGTDTQASAAISYLAANGSDEDFTEIEEQVLEKVIAYSWQGFTLAKSYLESRGEEGLPFFQKLEARIETHLAEEKKTSPDSFESSKETFESGLDSIRSLISSESAADLLAKIISGETDIYTIQEALIKKLAQESRADAIETLLDAAAGSEEVETSNMMMQLTGYLEQGEDYDPTVHKEKWLALLDDPREVQTMPFAATVAWNIESLASPDNAAPLQMLWQGAGIQCTPLLTERARARLSGTAESDLPAFPNKDDVTEERREELTKQLLELKDEPTEFRTAIDGLTLAERMWAVGDPRQPTEGEEEEIAPLVSAIEQVQFLVENVGIVDGWDEINQLKGKSLTAPAFLELIQSALRRSAAGEHFEIEITRRAGFGGWSIVINKLDPTSIPEEKNGISEARGNIHSRFEQELPFVALSFGDNNYRTMWFPEGTAEKLDSNRSSFLESLQGNTDRIEEMLPAWFQAAAGFQRGLTFSLVGTTATPNDENGKEN